MLLPLMAQNNTNSPYTRFGYGDLGERSFGAGRAMGGVGYGLRSPKQINPMNPASYSCMDSLTFLFDFGVAGQLSWFDDGNARQNDINGNVEYIAMQFPIHRRIALSFGLLPYSYVGYKFGALRNDEGVTFTETYNGSGDLSDFYGGVSIDIWKKRLAVGANFGFLFGNIKHEQVVIMSGEGTGAYNTNRNQELRVRDLKMDFGLQYTHPLSKTESVTLGLVFSPKKSLHAKSYQLTQSYTSSGSDGEVLQSDTISGKAFALPNSYGVGLSYGNSYLRMNRTDANPSGDGYNEIGASLGLGLPLIDNRSLINISFEYVKKKPEVKMNMIDEQYFRFTVNYTFNEAWFMKFKVD